jgi:hypothetical protein
VQGLTYIVREQASQSALPLLSALQTTYTDICLLVREQPRTETDGDDKGRAQLTASINWHCFYAHRALLHSHSEYFRVMFTGQFLESAQLDNSAKYVLRVF